MSLGEITPKEITNMFKTGFDEHKGNFERFRSTVDQILSLSSSLSLDEKPCDDQDIKMRVGVIVTWLAGHEARLMKEISSWDSRTETVLMMTKMKPPLYRRQNDVYEAPVCRPEVFV